MLITDYSFFMATIGSSLMIVMLYFLKRTRLFVDTFGVVTMLILYAFSLMRMLLPFEFPEIQTVIHDTVILTRVMDVLENRADITSDLPFPFVYILVAIAVIVSLVLVIIFVIRYQSYIKRVKALQNFVSDDDKIILDTVAHTVFSKDKDIMLIKTDTVSVPMVTGVIHNIMLLPNREYASDQLEMIFIHECTHLKNNDLWLKLLIHIYCCLFWFNPLVYLLKADIGFMLEIKCDNAVCAQFDELERLNYAQVMNSCATKSCKKPSTTSVMVASGFAFMDGTKQHIYRMNNILNYDNHRKKHILPTVLVSLLMVLICALSYLFIWQPSYDSDKSSFVLAQEEQTKGVEYSDKYNAYLVKQDDGNYIFYFDKFEVPVPKEEVDAGYYNIYPIYDEKP